MRISLQKIKNSSLIKGFIVTLIGSGLSRFFLVLTTFVVARMLSQDDFGQFSFVRSTMEMILSVCALNFSTLCTKYTTEIPKYESSFHKLVHLFLFSCAICVFVGLVLLILPKQFMAEIFMNDEIIHIFRIVGLLLPFMFLAPLIQAIYRGWLQFKFIGIMQNVEAVFFLAAAVMGVLTKGVVGALWAVVAYYLFRTIVFLIPMLRRVNLHSFTIRVKGFTAQKRVIVDTILPMFTMSFVEAPVFWLAQLLLTKFGGFASVAIMAVVLQVRNAIMIIPGYFFGTLMPFVSKLNAEKNYIDYYRKFDTLKLQLTLISVGIIFLLIIFGKFILSLFGSEYTIAYFPYILGIISLPLLILNLLFRIHMVVRERQKQLLYISIGWNSVWIILFFLFAKFLPISSVLSFFLAQDLALIAMITPMLIIYHTDKLKTIHGSK